MKPSYLCRQKTISNNLTDKQNENESIIIHGIVPVLHG